MSKARLNMIAALEECFIDHDISRHAKSLSSEIVGLLNSLFRDKRHLERDSSVHTAMLKLFTLDIDWFTLSAHNRGTISVLLCVLHAFLITASSNCSSVPLFAEVLCIMSCRCKLFDDSSDNFNSESWKLQQLHIHKFHLLLQCLVVILEKSLSCAKSVSVFIESVLISELVVVKCCVRSLVSNRLFILMSVLRIFILVYGDYYNFNPLVVKFGKVGSSVVVQRSRDSKLSFAAEAHSSRLFSTQQKILDSIADSAAASIYDDDDVGSVLSGSVCCANPLTFVAEVCGLLEQFSGKYDGSNKGHNTCTDLNHIILPINKRYAQQLITHIITKSITVWSDSLFYANTNSFELTFEDVMLSNLLSWFGDGTKLNASDVAKTTPSGGRKGMHNVLYDCMIGDVVAFFRLPAADSDRSLRHLLRNQRRFQCYCLVLCDGVSDLLLSLVRNIINSVKQQLSIKCLYTIAGDVAAINVKSGSTDAMGTSYRGIILLFGWLTSLASHCPYVLLQDTIVEVLLLYTSVIVQYLDVDNSTTEVSGILTRTNAVEELLSFCWNCLIYLLVHRVAVLLELQNTGQSYSRSMLALKSSCVLLFNRDCDDDRSVKYDALLCNTPLILRCYLKLYILPLLGCSNTQLQFQVGSALTTTSDSCSSKATRCNKLADSSAAFPLSHHKKKRKVKSDSEFMENDRSCDYVNVEKAVDIVRLLDVTQSVISPYAFALESKYQYLILQWPPIILKPSEQREKSSAVFKMPNIHEISPSFQQELLHQCRLLCEGEQFRSNLNEEHDIADVADDTKDPCSAALSPYDSLPYELNLMIVSFLSYKRLCRLSTVSKDYHNLCERLHFWKHLYCHRWPYALFPNKVKIYLAAVKDDTTSSTKLTIQNQRKFSILGTLTKMRDQFFDPNESEVMGTVQSYTELLDVGHSQEKFLKSVENFSRLCHSCCLTIDSKHNKCHSGPLGGTLIHNWKKLFQVPQICVIPQVYYYTYLYYCVLFFRIHVY